MKNYTYNQLGLLVTCLLLVGLLTPSVLAHAAPNSAPLRQTVSTTRPEDPACNAKTVNTRKITLPSNEPRPYWLFVMNFTQWDDASHPLACILLYPVGQQTPYSEKALKIRCVVKGIVRRTSPFDQVIFRKGYVRCPIDLLSAVNKNPDISHIIYFDPFYDYPQFTIVAAGQLYAFGRTDSNYTNPIVAYHRPDETSPFMGQVTDVALFIPLLQAQTASIAAYYQRELMTERSLCKFNFLGQSEYQWWEMHLSSGQINFLRKGQPLCSGSAPAAIHFETEGDEFRIGGSLLGPSFHGVLDEVIIDPTGSIKPQT